MVGHAGSDGTRSDATTKGGCVEPGKITFKLRFTAGLLALIGLPPAFAAGLGVLVYRAGRLHVGFPLAVLALSWILVVAGLVYNSLRIPTRIDLFEDGRVVFLSPARRVEISVLDFRSISPASGGPGHIVLTHSRGKLRLITQFDGFHELVAEFRRRNPRLSITGC